jgi:hypothetical protein
MALSTSSNFQSNIADIPSLLSSLLFGVARIYAAKRMGALRKELRPFVFLKTRKLVRKAAD